MEEGEELLRVAGSTDRSLGERGTTAPGSSVVLLFWN